MIVASGHDDFIDAIDMTFGDSGIQTAYICLVVEREGLSEFRWTRRYSDG